MQQLWHDWHDSGRPRAKLTPLLAAYQPYLDREVGRWANSGLPLPLLHAQAKRLAIGAIQTFDPSRAQLQTHLVTALHGLDRYVLTHRDAVRLPEQRAARAGAVYGARQDLGSELGREPTSDEIARRAGVPVHSLGQLQRHTEQLYSAAGEGMLPEREDLSHGQLVSDFLYRDLSPMQQKVFAHSTGYQGAEILSTSQMAGRFGVSAPRVSRLRNEIVGKARRYQGAVEGLVS